VPRRDLVTPRSEVDAPHTAQDLDRSNFFARLDAEVQPEERPMRLIDELNELHDYYASKIEVAVSRDDLA
jgi:hypothetical protein